MLYIVSTPIGNLKDITLRAIDTLKSVDLILVEDSRRTGKLLKEYNILKKCEVYNDINKVKKTDKIIDLLKKEQDIALVSDSGTPGINDPGFYLVRACSKNNIEVIPVPGACAAISALVCSGLPTDKFNFYGFMPKKEKKRQDILNQIKDIKGTKIFYESPYRLIKSLDSINKVLPDAKVVIAREMTKMHEEILRGAAFELLKALKKRSIKGEIVILIG